jgi:hypothetical protein
VHLRITSQQSYQAHNVCGGGDGCRTIYWTPLFMSCAAGWLAVGCVLSLSNLGEVMVNNSHRSKIMGEYVTWTFSPNNNGIAHQGRAG